MAWQYVSRKGGGKGPNSGVQDQLLQSMTAMQNSISQLAQSICTKPPPGRKGQGKGRPPKGQMPLILSASPRAALAIPLCISQPRQVGGGIGMGKDSCSIEQQDDNNNNNKIRLDHSLTTHTIAAKIITKNLFTKNNF